MCVAQCHQPLLVGMYTVSFIDDYSRKTWVYFLKSKDEVFGKFKEFKALIENLSKRKIKILSSDNGGEYTSKAFVRFCRDAGIKRELTTPYNPPQNGVAERNNRTIMEAVKTIIHDQDLPMHLGQKQQEQQCMSKIDYPIVHLDSKPPKKCSPERNHK
jgi:transposase InsO family protein